MKTPQIISRYKIAVVLLLFFSLSSVAVGFLFYTESQTKSAIISSQQELISSLQESIDKLNSNIQNLQNDLKSKETTIKDLGNRLGLAESQVELLRPTVKSYYAVGVRGSGQGVVIPIEVKLSTGKGLVSVNIKNVDLLSGAQESVRTSSSVASSATGISLAGKDIDVSFINQESEIVSVDGPSAGAAITTLLIAAIENKTMRTDILVTGTIEPDGRIGKVGGVLAKAIAAKDFNATIFLVPVGENVDVPNLSVREVISISNVTSAVLK